MLLLNALVKEQEDQTPDLEADEDFQEEQTLLGRLVSLLYSEQPDTQFLVQKNSFLVEISNTNLWLMKFFRFSDFEHGAKTFRCRRFEAN